MIQWIVQAFLYYSKRVQNSGNHNGTSSKCLLGKGIVEKMSRRHNCPK